MSILRPLLGLVDGVAALAGVPAALASDGFRYLCQDAGARHSTPGS